MKCDLTILPDDWVLALWWTEFPAGQFDLLPRGGHRIALVRLLVPGSARQAPTWVTEDCTRPCGEEEWRRSQSFSTGGLLALLEGMEVRQRYFTAAACPGGRIDIMGGPQEARARFDSLRHSPRPLPAWLRVQIVERRERADATAERSAEQ